MSGTRPGAFDSLPHADQLAVLEDLANEALDHYEIGGEPRARLLNLSENATYAVDGADRRYALRIHRDGYHTPAAIASELSWLVALREAGIVITPRPVWTRDGVLIAQVGHPMMSRPRSVVLFDWETGAEPGIDDDLAGPFEKLGAVTARMHGHARAWTPPTGFTRPVWNFETALAGAVPHWGRWQDGMGMTPASTELFGRTVETIGRRLARFGSGPDRFGLVHCDLRLANLLIDGPAVKVIDFDDCGFSWFLYDAATPVSFYEDDPRVPATDRRLAAGIPRRGTAQRGGRRRDPDLRHAPPAASGRLDRLAFRDRPCPVDGRRLYPRHRRPLRSVPDALRHALAGQMGSVASPLARCWR